MISMPTEFAKAFCARATNANKREVGVVSIVGGSSHFINAPVIAGLGARAAGAGLVQLTVPDASRIGCGALLPEATFTKLTPTCVPPKADVLAIGMGLGNSVTVEVLVSRLLSGASGRFVLDADALAVFAGWYGRGQVYKPGAGQSLVFTPHEGEAARLLGWTVEKVKSNRDEAAVEMVHRYGATVVLKGAHTIVISSDGEKVYHNATGNPYMALGGMGDLLSGVIAARWAYLKADAFTAAASAVWLHALASDLLIEEGGDPSIVNTATKLGSLRVRLDRQLSL